MIPPALVKVHIVENGRRRINIWFPIILLWVLLMLISLALLPILIFIDLLLRARGRTKGCLYSMYCIFSVLNALRGTEVRVINKKQQNLVDVRLL